MLKHFESGRGAAAAVIFALAGAAILGAPAQPPADVLGAVPRDLGPDQYFAGTPWVGPSGITETVAEITARHAAEPPVSGPPRERRPEQSESEHEEKRPNPNAPASSHWPLVPAIRETAEGGGSPGPGAFTLTSSWLGPKVSESGFIPPDSNGAVSPTQVMVTANGRFKVFDKAGNPQALDVTDSVFFNSVRGGVGISDPHVRFDRLSQRWFISEITVANTSNRILIAVSSGPTITSASSFTFHYFAHDAVGPTPNIDTGHFADYDTLGVDANALYIGVNEFTSGSGSFQNTSGYVVNKADLLSGSLTVTAFRGLAVGVGAGLWTPQGVNNDDPAAAEGYFIGVDNAAFSLLQLRRVTNPGSAPSISGNISLTVPTTYFPIAQVAQGSVRPLDALDDRLFAAMIEKNKLTGISSLWTAHNIRVNSTGVGGVGGNRNAGRWYQIDNLSTAPTLTQSGTVFDSATSNPAGLWINSIAANGQGHAAMGQSYAGAALTPGLAVVSRASSDAAGDMSGRQSIGAGGSYNVQIGGTAPQRWGDYSQVVVDPADDMTLWTFQEYADATNSWGVRAVKLAAPPPATPSTAIPSGIPMNVASTNVTITGTPVGGSGFFDPGSGFPNRIAAAVSGNVTVNSVTFTDATHLTLNVSTVGASPGAKNVTITNPDGQTIVATALITVTSGSVPTSPPPGDFDGNGTTDLAVYRPATGTWSVRDQFQVQWGQQGDIPVAGDYNGDTLTDLAVYRPSTGMWFVRNQFQVQFGNQGDIPVPGDYNGDGARDLAVYRPATATWFVRNQLTMQFGQPGDIPVPGDYNGDGTTDIAIYQPSTGMWFVRDPAVVPFVQVQFGMQGDIPVPGDYNADGVVDIAVFRPATGTWYVRNQFAVQFGQQGDVPIPGDYNADHVTDVAVFRPSTGMWFVRNQFQEQFGQQGDIPVPARPTVPHVSGDYNGDGVTDIGVYQPSTGTWLVRNQFTVQWGISGDIPVPGDYDGDGVTDVAVYRPSIHTWFVHYQYWYSVQFGSGDDVPVPADYNGDGITDIAVFRPSTGEWLVRNQFVAQWGQAGDVPVPGDYDGDGIVDIAVYRPSTTTWFVRYPFWFSVQFGQPGDIPVAGDYNGDGVTDFAVYAPSSGTWSIRNQYSAQWGVAGDLPVQGDYDGDGVTDVAVYRPSTGTWYVLYPFWFSVMWGESTDIPVARPPY
jgi:hypothetical protein